MDAPAWFSAIARQGTAQVRHDFFASVIAAHSQAFSAIFVLTNMCEVSNYETHPAHMTSDNQIQLCNKFIQQVSLLVPFSVMAAAIHETIQMFYDSITNPATTDRFIVLNNIFTRGTLELWQCLFHDIPDKLQTKVRISRVHLQISEQELLHANLAVSDLLGEKFP